MYNSFSPFSFSFCIQVQKVKTQMKCSIYKGGILSGSALPSARTEKHNFIYFTYPLQYIFRMKRVNLQHSIYRLLDRYSLHVISILFKKNVDPDQTASSETSCSGSTVLPKRMQYCLSQIYFRGKKLFKGVTSKMEYSS